MNLKKFKEKYFMFLYICYIISTGSFFLGMVIESMKDIDFYYLIYAIPFVYIILNNIDLEDKEVLDEYLFLTISAILFGLFFSDINDFGKYLSNLNLWAYFFIMSIYILILGLINNIIKNIVRKVD